MKVHISGSMVHLEGNWSLTGVTQISLNSLVGALQQIKPDDTRKLHIDCRHVLAIDSTGRQLLKVWMQCAKLRGLEPELINLPNELNHLFIG